MQLRTLLAVGFLVALLIPASASAYTPRHGKSCRHGYVTRHRTRRRHGRKHRVRICVKRKATLAAPIVMKLHAHLDPSFTRDSLDPFKVTYQFSASATQARTDALTASIVEEPAPLPSGVLSLYTDGKLECAVNVGGSATASECPVTYEKLGEHRVTTLYTSGEESATETEVENIGPLATTTTLSITYVPLENPVEVGNASGVYHIGDLSIQLGASPADLGAHLGCGEGSSERLTENGCYEVEDPQQHVYASVKGECSAPERGAIRISHATELEGIKGEALNAEDLESGIYHLRAAVMEGAGYRGSEVTAALRFDPAFQPAPDC